MSPLPVRLRNRWENRAEPGLNSGTVYWHMLMRAYPRACEAAADAQKALNHFSGLHMTPLEWLHITMLIAGSTEVLTREQMSAMVANAQESLRGTKPIPVIFEDIFYHPEAISLGVKPVTALVPVLEGVRSATREVIGQDGLNDDGRSPWIPHMTVSYSTAEQSAGPIVSALGTRVERRKVVLNAVSLVIQWGPERCWNWEPVGTVDFAETTD